MGLDPPPCNLPCSASEPKPSNLQAGMQLLIVETTKTRSVAVETRQVQCLRFNDSRRRLTAHK